MGGRLSRKKKGYEVGDTIVGQAEAAVAGTVEATNEAAQEVSAELVEGAAAASQEVSSTLEATAEAAAEVVKEAIAAAESVPAAVSEVPKAEDVADITQEVVSTVVSDVPSAEVTVPSVEITSTEPAPAETAPEPEQEATAAEEPVTAEEEPATTEPESAPEPNTETIQSESADLPAETIPGLQAEIEAAATGTVSDLISTSASGAEEAAGTKADDKGAPSEEATVENGDCEIADSSAGPPAPLELNSESQEQVLQPAVEQLAEECLNGIGLPAEPPKEKTDCELKKDWELPEAIGELGEAVSAPVNQVVDLV